MAETNYAGTFTKGGNPVGNCLVLDYPEITTGNIDATHHGSLGIEARIPDGLVRLGAFTLELIIASGMMEAIQSDMNAKTVDACVLELGDVVRFTFNGFYTSVKPEAADAQSPDLAKASVTVQPTGGITIVSL